MSQRNASAASETSNLHCADLGLPFLVLIRRLLLPSLLLEEIDEKGIKTTPTASVRNFELGCAIVEAYPDPRRMLYLLRSFHH